jgi:thioredoxin 1
MSSLPSVDDANFQSEVLDSEDLVMVDFWAPWCGPCRMQTPLLEKLASARDDVKIVKLNVDESPKTAATYGIRSIPTLALFKGGKPVLGTLGLQNEANLTKLIDEAKKKAAEA